MARMLNSFGFVGIEINGSCPNSGEELSANASNVIEGCRRVSDSCHLPIVLKLAVNQDIERIVIATEGIVQAYAINSVAWDIAFPDKTSPLAHLGGGGVSGKAAQPHTWKLVRRLSNMTDVPVIGPSVWEFGDIARLRDMGASAISFGSIFLRYPWRPTQFVRKDMKSCAR